jgi:hypothetical protein
MNKMKLNIQLFSEVTSGSVITGNYQGRYVRFNWSIKSQSIDNNNTIINYTLLGDGDAESSYYYSGPFLLKIQGNEVYKSSSRIQLKKGTVLTKGTLTIKHNDDGTKSFSVEIKAAIYKSSYNCNGSGTFDLKSIPRASTISALDCNIESSTLISIDRKSNIFYSDVTYSFGSLSGTLLTKSDKTSLSWTIPTSFYNQIPNSKTGEVLLTCNTYKLNNSNYELIGTKACKFIVTASEDKCKPNLTATIEDSNSICIALTGNKNKFIKYKPKITFASTAKNGSSIISTKINNIDKLSPSIIDWSDSITITTVDSRGYTNSIIYNSNNLTIINYIPLSISAVADRVDSTSGKVKLDFSGNIYNGSFGVTDNQLSIYYKYKEDESETYSSALPLSATIKNNTYSGSIILENFDYRKKWNIIVYVSDGSSTNILSSENSGVQLIRKGIPNHNWFDVDEINYFNVNGFITMNENYDCLGFNKVGTYEEI